MNRTLLPLFLFCLLSILAKAQTPFPTMDSLDINKIHASVLVHGDMWWDPANNIEKCNLYNTGKGVNFAGSIWMSGYDDRNILHTAAQTYRQDGNDYWPGPLDTSDTLTYSTSQQWAKIWKISGTDIQAFISLPTHTTSNTPPAILTWPAKGNVNATGNGGTALTITDDMAPFVDLNGNGIYEPLLGEYPDFPGDQALWWVFSNNGPTHIQTHSHPLGVEVHAMAYAYNRGTLIDNVIYYDYTLINRSANNYHDLRFGIWDDVDLGWYMDDFIAFDSSRRLGICYNGTNDDGGSYGHPAGSFGPRPPMMGVTMIHSPGDTGTNYIPSGSFVYYNNDASIIGNPMNDMMCDHYLRAIMVNGQPFGRYTDDFHDSIPDTLIGPPIKYCFQIDTVRLHSECLCNNNPGDRRFIFGSNDFILNAGSVQHFVVALIATDTGVGGCPFSNFDEIRMVSDTAWNGYYAPPAPLHRSLPPETTGIVNIYPNPANKQLYIEDRSNTSSIGTISVYDIAGNTIIIPVTKVGTGVELNIARLPVGPYYVRYNNCGTYTITKFIKE